MNNPGKTIKLVWITEGIFQLKDLDKIEWVKPEDLKEYNMAPADIPLILEYEKQRLNR